MLKRTIYEEEHEIFRKTGIAENGPHHRLVPAGTRKVNREVLAAIRLEVLQPPLDRVVDRDWDIEGGTLGLGGRRVRLTEQLQDFLPFYQGFSLQNKRIIR